jgi:beta-lactamase regulating signal transducer with metallopeptidase domain
MSPSSIDVPIQLAVDLLLKASLLLTIAELLHTALRRRASAAARHLIRALTVVGLLILPVLSAVLPGWRMPTRLGILAAPTVPVTLRRSETASPVVLGGDADAFSSNGGASAESARTAGTSLDTAWVSALEALYVAGVLLLLARLIVEQVTLQRLARRAAAQSESTLTRLLFECAQLMSIQRPVRVLQSGEHRMPMVFGTRVPIIVLPAAADSWTQDRRRAVFLHELAHVARYDCLTQLAAAVACALYWIHPGVWWIARRLRVERELACDDRVLAAGTRPAEYAGHLLDLAYSLQSRGALAHAADMARPRQLEARLLAIVDPATRRAVPARGVHAAGIIVMAALSAAIAGARPMAVQSGADTPSVPQRSDGLARQMTVIDTIEFVGNQAISSGTLKRQMTGIHERRIWTRLFASPTSYEEAKVEEDARRITQYYRNHGFITARVGKPELRLVRESADASTRFVTLRIPVVEGDRFKVGAFDVDGNTVIRSEDLRRMFNLAPGTDYREMAIHDGLERAREAYGAAGYFEFTGYPDFAFQHLQGVAGPVPPEALQIGPLKPPAATPIVDVTMRLREGPQYFVNRLTWTRSAARDRVIRREMRLVEGDVFNTEALKLSIRRLNQLGYFKPIDGRRDVDVRKTPGAEGRVDVNVRLEER